MRYLIWLAYHTYRLIVLVSLAITGILMWIVHVFYIVVQIPMMLFELQFMDRMERKLLKQYDQHWK